MTLETQKVSTYLEHIVLRFQWIESIHGFMLQLNKYLYNILIHCQWLEMYI